MSKILIIFSTVGGNTEMVVDKVASVWKEGGLEVTLVRAELANLAEIKNFDLTVLASPTYNQGTLEAYFQKFMVGFEKTDFRGLKFAVIGLGDNHYYPEYLTEAAGILEDGVKATGGELLVPALRIGSLPVKFLDTLVKKWAEKVAGEIKKIS